MSRLKIIKTVLKFEYKEPRKVKWWLKDESFIPVAKSIADAVRDITNNIIPPDIKIFKRTVFKQTERKIVFSIKHPQKLESSFVVKVFFLVHLSHKLNYRLYGLDEAANSIRARSSGINTPEIYGCGHVYNALGLVKASVVVFEHLHHITTIGELMRTRPDGERAEILMCTVPLFISLYKANCNHIDVNHGAVALCEHNLNHEVFLLDFHHTKFYNAPSLETLMFEAAHLTKSCRSWISTEIINEWLNKLLTSVGTDKEGEKEEMVKRFNYYFEADLSRKVRKKIR